MRERKYFLAEQRFGRLFVLGEVRDDRNRLSWLCRCDCGETRAYSGRTLVKGLVTSCGCRKREGLHTTHGLSDTREYRAWCDMKRRCNAHGREDYAYYGGRGIKVCERWLHSFENFLADMGACPIGLTLERNNVNGHYEPGNCRWATRIEQARNRRTVDNSVRVP